MFKPYVPPSIVVLYAILMRSVNRKNLYAVVILQLLDKMVLFVALLLLTLNVLVALKERPSKMTMSMRKRWNKK